MNSVARGGLVSAINVVQEFFVPWHISEVYVVQNEERLKLVYLQLKAENNSFKNKKKYYEIAEIQQQQQQQNHSNVITLKLVSD